MDSTQVILPFSTSVSVQAFTNAAFGQQITITPESGAPTVFTGSGEGQTPIGTTGIKTPSSGSNPSGFVVNVTVDSNSGGGWQPSAINQCSFTCWYYNGTMVVSEDYLDNDWNDGLCLFSWWTSPAARQAPEVSLINRPLPTA